MCTNIAKRDQCTRGNNNFCFFAVWRQVAKAANTTDAHQEGENYRVCPRYAHQSQKPPKWPMHNKGATNPSFQKHRISHEISVRRVLALGHNEGSGVTHVPRVTLGPLWVGVARRWGMLRWACCCGDGQNVAVNIQTITRKAKHAMPEAMQAGTEHRCTITRRGRWDNVQGEQKYSWLPLASEVALAIVREQRCLSKWYRPHWWAKRSSHGGVQRGPTAAVVEW